MSNTSEVRKLVRLLVKQGIRVERARNGHLDVYCPDGQRVQLSFSPSDHRAIRNTKANLRRHGINLPR